MAPGEIRRRLAKMPIRVEDGRPRLPDPPKFGVAPDETIVALGRSHPGAGGPASPRIRRAAPGAPVAPSRRRRPADAVD